MSEVWINDVDLADYGFILGVNPAHADAPDFTDATAALLGQIGPTFLNEPVQAGARKLMIGGYLVAASAALLRTYSDTLKLLASVGAVRIRFADRTDQEFRDARLMGVRVTPRAAILTNLAADVQLTFEVADPLRFDVNPQGVALSTARASLPTGTAPSFPIITIHGGGATVTNPSLTLRNAAGDSVQTMGLSTASLGGGVLGANDYVMIDCVRTRLVKSIAGVQSDGTALWTSGDFPVIRPSDGWWELAQYPTLELAATAGGPPVGLCSFARRWL